MQQRGQIFKSHGAWFVRFYNEEIVDGQRVRRRITKRLAAVSPEFSRARDCWTLAAEHTDPVNRGRATPEGSLTLDDFVDRYFVFDNGSTDQSLLVAGLFIALVPPLLIFLIFQRYIVKGVGFTGLKG